MILASIGSNYSLETNSLSVCHRKYLLKYLAVLVLATLLGKEETCTQSPSQGKSEMPSAAVKTIHSLQLRSYV